MTTVFIAGSMSIKHLHPMVADRLANIVESSIHVVVGDADGADTSIQTYLADAGHSRATVFCTERPRNNVGNWPVRVIESNQPAGSRGFFTAKDVAMAEAADIGLMIWDTKSTGTLNNVLELLFRKKKVVVFVNKLSQFVNISSVRQFESALLPLMSDGALAKAEQKLRLREKIARLRQSAMF